MPLNRRQHRRVARTFSVLGLLTLHLACGTGWLPLLTAVVAWCDGQHRVYVQSGSDQIKVVLAHCHCAQTHPDRCPGHEHGGLSSLLSFLAEPTATQADHVLAFSQVSNYRTGHRAEISPSLPAPADLHSADPGALRAAWATATRVDSLPRRAASGPLSLSVVRLI